MNLFFDTSILIDLERRKEEVLIKINDLREVYPAPALISFVSYVEFLHGLRDKSKQNREKSRFLIDKFRVIQTTNKTAEILLMLKEKYEYPLADLLIASQVIENDGILLTKDKDFEGIKELNKIVI